jgi:hypothetical protein
MPSEEMIEAPILHHHDDDVIDAGQIPVLRAVQLLGGRAAGDRQ